jgi:drug/metabolite transporter (DMT)-like permease
MDGSGPRPDTSTLGAFGALVVIGGGNFVAVRASNLELPPFWGAGLRFALAGTTFVLLSAALRLRPPRGRLLALSVGYGALAFGLFFGLMYWALTLVTAGVATVVMASVPLVTLLLAAAQGTERLRTRSVAGALLAIGGITWMVLGPQPVDVPFVALLLMLAAAAAVSQSIIVGKHLSVQHPAMTNAIGLSVGATLLLAASALIGESWWLPREPEARWAVLYLVTFGSVGLFVLVLLVVRRWTASATSYMFVLFPLATMGIERVLFDEPVSGQMLVGAGLVIAGVWLGALRSTPASGVPWFRRAVTAERSGHTTSSALYGGGRTGALARRTGDGEDRWWRRS